ncbi:MAG: hypothetical protein ABFC56_13385 [Clostridiaceae bacterium]
MEQKKKFIVPPVQNTIFSGIRPEQMVDIRRKAIPAPKITLCSTYLTPSREVVPIAEALVAWDPVRRVVAKFIAAFVPGSPASGHEGKKFLISRKNPQERQTPILIEKRENGNPNFPWNGILLRTHLDSDKLPQTVQTEFRILRAYRYDVRTRYRFEILAFDIPQTGDIDKRTMRLECAIPRIPPIELVQLFGGFVWWQKAIAEELSMFSGEDIAFVLGLDARVREDLRSGKISPEDAEAMLADHSAEGEQTESLAETLGVKGVTPNMKHEDEEGKEFFVPRNPMLSGLPPPPTDPMEMSLGNALGGMVDAFTGAEPLEEEDDDGGPVNALAVNQDVSEEEVIDFPEEL